VTVCRGVGRLRPEKFSNCLSAVLSILSNKIELNLNSFIVPVTIIYPNVYAVWSDTPELFFDEVCLTSK
jgi:hypothetical protein